MTSMMTLPEMTGLHTTQGNNSYFYPAVTNVYVVRFIRDGPRKVFFETKSELRFSW
jgi:hypothetical protein